MSPDGILESYEQTPYATGAHWESHPDNMATVAALLGLEAPDPGRCRVLELGCATGGNLLPMAVGLPDARFVGIDLSPRQIEIASRIVDFMQLANVQLHAMDLMDFGKGMGEFDYIICHGVYSWVPDAVREKILEICREHLSSGGVAYISYNTYPGWHCRGIVQEMMAWHARRFHSPADRIAQARRLMATMSKAVGTRDTAYGQIIAAESRELTEDADYYVLHEHLDGQNHPLYFHEFQAQLAQAGLTYLSEGAIESSAWGRHAASVEAALAELATDPLDREQYLDYLICRPFRRSLVCHKDALPTRGLRADSLRRLRFSGTFRCEASSDAIEGNDSVKFTTSDGKSFSTNHPPTKRMLWALKGNWPGALGLGELAACLAGAADESALAPILLELVQSRLLHLHREPPRECTVVSPLPRAFEYARRQAEDGVEVVTNMRHRSVILENIDPAVLPLLDGTRDVHAIAGAIAARVEQGEISIGKSADPGQMRAALEEYVRAALPRFRNASLLAN